MKLPFVSKLRHVLSSAIPWAVVVSATVLSTSCSRSHIEAINLANQGDRAVAVNVEGAISKYEQAMGLDPTNHRIIWKLAKAYEKKEDWDKMASTLSRAVSIAPEFANYWYKRGFALMQIARDGNPDQYTEAKEPLKKCIEHDPGYAECYHELGDASWWTDDEQAAIDNFSKAIQHNSTIPYFYPPLADLYIALKLYDQAKGVLEEGTRIIPPTEKTNNALYGMFTLLANVNQARDDLPGMVSTLEKAEEVAGDSHPEILFNLGSTYAVMDPPQKEKAIRRLKSFSKRACRSAKAKKYKDQCETTSTLIQKLGASVN